MLRFAPSPTKDLNIENLRVALFNFILSKQLKQDLLIRIDDTQKEKNIEGKDKEILELLSLFSMDYKGVVYQSENLKYHQKMVMQLMAQKKAFSCFCSDDKLEELQQEANKAKKPYEYDGFCATLSDETVLNCNAPFTVRMQKPQSSISYTDTLKGKLEFTPSQVDAFVVLDHNKSPLYNYACAVDDMLYNISTVLRGEEHIPNTPKQIHVRALLGYDQPIEYIHVPRLENGETEVQSLIDEGFLPSAIANYLVLLSMDTPTQIFTLEEAIEWFDIKKVVQTPLSFDKKKLEEINRQHLETMDDMRLSKILGFADTDIGKLAKLYLQEVSTIKEIKEKLDVLFAPKGVCEGFENESAVIKECLKDAPYFNELDELKAFVIEKTALEEKAVDKALQYLMTGRNEGPALCTVYPLIKNYLGEIIK